MIIIFLNVDRNSQLSSRDSTSPVSTGEYCETNCRYFLIIESDSTNQVYNLRSRKRHKSEYETFFVFWSPLNCCFTFTMYLCIVKGTGAFKKVPIPLKAT